MLQLTNIYKLLSDETRLRMLLLLHQERLCVCELVGILSVPQPRISKNLSKLRDLGLVTDERKDKFIQYTLVDHPILSASLENLMVHLADYPILLEDHQRLASKASYIENCEVPNF